MMLSMSRNHSSHETLDINHNSSYYIPLKYAKFCCNCESIFYREYGSRYDSQSCPCCGSTVWIYLRKIIGSTDDAAD